MTCSIFSLQTGLNGLLTGLSGLLITSRSVFCPIAVMMGLTGLQVFF